VVVINTAVIAYWRSQENPDAFHSNIKRGAHVETDDDPQLQEAAKTAVLSFCEKTRINLAGFDFLFSEKSLENNRVEPLFLEINFLRSTISSAARGWGDPRRITKSCTRKLTTGYITQLISNISLPYTILKK